MGNEFSRILESYRKTCPICGKEHCVQSLNEYVYKRVKRSKKGDKVLYFCSWTCLRKYDKAHEPKMAVEKVHEWEQYHTCLDCRFYHDGNRRCDRGITLHPYPDRDACSSFRELPAENPVWKRGKAKLTDSDIREIKRLYNNEYMTQQAIADRFGVSRSYIVAILER